MLTKQLIHTTHAYACSIDDTYIYNMHPDLLISKWILEHVDVDVLQAPPSEEYPAVTSIALVLTVAIEDLARSLSLRINIPRDDLKLLMISSFSFVQIRIRKKTLTCT